ncbi:MAG TPA: acyloxyacyl hydrolase [Thermoanaerobaculia bacterium]|nr:acyloxyacyl hydrolase [Thermoanaerobaculia bacterium]
MRAALLAAALAACAASGVADDTDPIPAGRPPEWSLAAGYGFSFKVNGGRADEHLVLFEPGVSFRLGRRLEYVVEGHFAGYFSPSGYMLGVVPIGLRYSIGNGRLLPYVMLGAGAGWTDLTALDEISRRFNFLLQGAVGVRGALPNGQAWTLEWRWDHISNAGTVDPNLGLNASVFLLGWRF